VKPLRLDWFERLDIYKKDVLHPFREAWIKDEYDEVMEIYDLNPEDWL